MTIIIISFANHAHCSPTVGLRRPRNGVERGASLIMLVSIIGVAFIVTIAGFLVTASDQQDTARLASAKVDVATREDALMREILQQTATGMLPDAVTGLPLTWTQIMTAAVNNLNATSFVTTSEFAGLRTAGAIPANVTLANTGDTGGTLLGIFQGYNRSEVPYGGTSNIANFLNSASPSPSPPYNSAVEPPLMNWPASTPPTLTAATALTTPQEFFLGSLYVGTSPPLSASKRWAQISYPNVRFGYKQPNDLFICRQVWWRIPLVYQTNQQTVEDNPLVYRYPSAPANYVLSVYEIPSQLPISGNANLQIGLNSDGTAWGSQIQVTGSIYGNQIQLSAGSYAGVSSRNQVHVVSPANVGGVAYSNSNFDAVGTREQLALTQTPGVAAPVSVIGNAGKVLLVPVMPGNQFYMSVAATATTPTHWDLYARPYYRCRIRIIISHTDATIIYSPTQTPQTNTAAGAITVQTIVLSDPYQLPDQILGFPDSAATTNTTITQTSIAAGGLPAYMNYTSTAAGDRNILVIDVPTMVATLSSGTPPQLYSIYIGSNPTTEPAASPSPAPPPYTEPGVGITNTNDLSAFTSGLSIVANQTLYLLDSFNQVAPKPPTSVYAPQVRYGISGAISPVALTGQISVDPIATPTPGSTPGSVNPFSLVNASGTPIPASSISANFNEITDPTLIPPIPRLSLMFTIEKERTN